MGKSASCEVISPENRCAQADTCKSSAGQGLSRVIQGYGNFLSAMLAPGLLRNSVSRVSCRGYERKIHDGGGKAEWVVRTAERSHLD